MNIANFNTLARADAVACITQCCAAHRWVAALVDGRPYHDLAALLDAAATHWRTMRENDLLEAFSAHPQIGNVDTLRAQYANTKTLAAGEQAGVNEASEATLQALALRNQAYLDTFGFIFIVCATGKSAQAMLTLLTQRLTNSRSQELQHAAIEQHKITVLRLHKLFNKSV